MGGISVIVGLFSEEGLKTMLLGALLIVMILLEEIRLEIKKKREEKE